MASPSSLKRAIYLNCFWIGHPTIKNEYMLICLKKKKAIFLFEKYPPKRAKAKNLDKQLNGGGFDSQVQQSFF